MYWRVFVVCLYVACRDHQPSTRLIPTCIWRPIDNTALVNRFRVSSRCIARNPRVSTPIGPPRCVFYSARRPKLMVALCRRVCTLRRQTTRTHIDMNKHDTSLNTARHSNASKSRSSSPAVDASTGSKLSSSAANNEAGAALSTVSSKAFNSSMAEADDSLSAVASSAKAVQQNSEKPLPPTQCFARFCLKLHQQIKDLGML